MRTIRSRLTSTNLNKIFNCYISFFKKLGLEHPLQDKQQLSQRKTREPLIRTLDMKQGERSGGGGISLKGHSSQSRSMTGRTRSSQVRGDGSIRFSDLWTPDHMMSQGGGGGHRRLYSVAFPQREPLRPPIEISVAQEILSLRQNLRLKCILCRNIFQSTGLPCCNRCMYILLIFQHQFYRDQGGDLMNMLEKIKHDVISFLQRFGRVYLIVPWGPTEEQKMRDWMEKCRPPLKNRIKRDLSTFKTLRQKFQVQNGIVQAGASDDDDTASILMGFSKFPRASSTIGGGGGRSILFQKTTTHQQQGADLHDDSIITFSSPERKSCMLCRNDFMFIEFIVCDRCLYNLFNLKDSIETPRSQIQQIQKNVKKFLAYFGELYIVNDWGPKAKKKLKVYLKKASVREIQTYLEKLKRLKQQMQQTRA
jgi:hypothetical protein